MIHELRCWPDQFDATYNGNKTHEVRVNDRDFQVGDYLFLREFVPCSECKGSGRLHLKGGSISFDDGVAGTPVMNIKLPCCEAPHGTYSSRTCYVKVSYITPGGEWGIPADSVVLSVKLFDRPAS